MVTVTATLYRSGSDEERTHRRDPGDCGGERACDGDMGSHRAEPAGMVPGRRNRCVRFESRRPRAAAALLVNGVRIDLGHGRGSEHAPPACPWTVLRPA